MSAHSTPSRLSSGPLWHPTEYPRILYKRRAIAIPVFLLFFLSGTISSVRTVPTYEAMTQVLIEPEARRPTTLSTVLESEPDAEDDFYQTQYRILESRSLAYRAVDALEKDGIVERLPPPRRFSFSISGMLSAVRTAVTSIWSDQPAPAQANSTAADETRAQSAKIDAFLGGLNVTPVRFSRLVEIRFRSPDMEFAAHAANQLAKQYIVHSLEYRFLASKEANDWLSKQLREQREIVAASDAALQRFRETHNAVSIGDRQNITIQKLTELNAQVTRAKIERVDKETLYRQLMQLRESNAALDTFPAIVQNEVIQKTKTEISALRDEKAKLEAKGYGSAHQEIKTNASRLSAAEARLNAEMENVAQSVKNDFEAARAKEASLVQALEAQKGEANVLGAKEVQYAALEREAVGNRKLYEDLLGRTKETGVSGQFAGSTVQVVDPAEVPESPVLPKVQRDMTVAALTGFVLAVMLAFGFEYFDSRIKSPEEIKAHLGGIPFLGLVPVAPGVKDLDGEAPLLSGEGPPAFAEAMRGLRTAVLFSSADEGARSVLVTSTGPSEGKTVIAGCLAITLAQAGQRTLVIDADMRRPRLHEALGRPQEPGLSNLLVGDTSIDDAIRQTTMQNLWLVSAGHIPPNPAELLGSKKFASLFDDFKKRFDWVIVDAPPVLPVTDAAVLGHLTSGVLFVIGAEMTPRSSAANAIEQLRRARAKMIGVVLNRVNVHRHSYYYRAYYRKEYAKYYQGSANRA